MTDTHQERCRKKGSCMKTRIIGVVLIVLICITGVLLRGVACQWLWEWFIATPFGLRPLAYWHALGLASTITYLTWTYAEDTREWPDRFAETFALTGMVLAIGKLCSLGM